MSKIKLISFLLIFVVFWYRFDDHVNNVNKKNYETSLITNFEINVDNAIVNVKTTDANEVSVEFIQTNNSLKSHELYSVLEDGNFKIGQYNKIHKKSLFRGFKTDVINIFVPQDFVIDNFDYFVNTGSLNISAAEINNISIESEDVGFKFSDLVFKNVNSKSNYIDGTINNVFGDSVLIDATTGSVISSNSRLKSLTVHNLSHSTIELRDSIIVNTDIAGNTNQIYLTLSELKNYDIKTDKAIKNPSFSKSTSGYSYNGSVEDETNIINLNSNKIKKIIIQ